MLAKSRLAHLRELRAAPASVQSMVGRTAGHSSSDEKDEMSNDEMKNHEKEDDIVLESKITQRWRISLILWRTQPSVSQTKKR